ncbi:MAG: HAD family phosphatase [Acidimicrobiia bacterium]
MTISAVVFDLGGVLTVPPFVGINAYEDEIGLPRDSLIPYFRGDPVMSRVERGEIPVRDFWKYLGTTVQERHGVRIDLRRFAEVAETAGSLEPQMIDLVRELHGRYRLGLLTNNVKEASKWRRELPHDLFDVQIDSSDVGLRKPDPLIYELMVEKIGHPASKIAYVDDFEENLPPARDLGLNVVHFTDPGQCRAALEAFGIDISNGEG